MYSGPRISKAIAVENNFVVDAVGATRFGRYESKVSEFETSTANNEIFAPESALLFTKFLTRESMDCAWHQAALKKTKSKLYLCSMNMSTKMLNSVYSNQDMPSTFQQ